MPEIAIIYNPTINQLFTARKGEGSYLNGKRIYVSKVTDPSKALLMTEAGTSRDIDKMNVILQNYNKLIPLVHG